MSHSTSQVVCWFTLPYWFWFWVTFYYLKLRVYRKPLEHYIESALDTKNCKILRINKLVWRTWFVNFKNIPITNKLAVTLLCMVKIIVYCSFLVNSWLLPYPRQDVSRGCLSSSDGQPDILQPSWQYMIRIINPVAWISWRQLKRQFIVCNTTVKSFSTSS